MRISGLTGAKHRLITRADFDGVVCGGLLYEQGLIDDVVFAEPREMQTGTFPVRPSDITANLPYVPSVHHCFDHLIRVGEKANLTIDDQAPSAARVAYEYYGGADGFPQVSKELIDAVDKAVSAQFGESEFLSPDGWVLVNFILDPRTGLSQAADFSISHDQFMKDMMVYCRHHPVEEILKLPDMAERVGAFWTNGEAYEKQLRHQTRIKGNVAVVDLRKEERIYAGNPFTVYAFFPECNVSITLQPRTDSDLVTIAVGKSIVNRTSQANIGAILLEYGGGGHRAAGMCHAAQDVADKVVGELVGHLDSQI